MLASIFTPTDNTQFLQEAYESLKSQTYTNWEWVILPNNGAVVPDFGDDRVRVLPSPDVNQKHARYIGYLKNTVCMECKGDVLIELDHDDFLHEEAVQRVIDVLIHEGYDFCYSRFAEFYNDTKQPRTNYSPKWGWIYDPYEYKGVQYMVPRLFPPEPQYMLNITHGPNHLRAWKKSVYHALEGHRVHLEAADDYDIYMRTYCDGFKIKAIDECLYFYRWMGTKEYDLNREKTGQGNKENNQGDTINNTVMKNKVISENRQFLYFEFIIPSMLRWCNENNLKAIDLGAAHSKPSGFIGVDQFDEPGVDVVCDLSSFPWPFETGSVGLIRACDFIEHIEDKVGLINEIWRVLAPMGVVVIDVPSTDGRGAFQDPTHVSYYNEHSMWYYIQDSYKKYVKGLKCAFWPLLLRTSYPSQWHYDNNIPYVQSHLVAIKNGIRIPQPYPIMSVPKES